MFNPRVKWPLKPSQVTTHPQKGQEPFCSAALPHRETNLGWMDGYEGYNISPKRVDAQRDKRYKLLDSNNMINIMPEHFCKMYDGLYDKGLRVA